jgi:alkane 1-monooxygenase
MPMIRFAVASLVLVALLGAAALFGGGWAYAALAYVTVFVALMDRIGRVRPAAADDARAARFARDLTVTLALAHLAVLPLGVWAVAAAPWLDAGQRLALGLALGLFAGQVSHPNAHELIHAPGRVRRWLGVAVYVSLLFGHHVSAHLKVHHVHVATGADPNSAPAGRGFWRFLPRAWAGSFVAGLRAETAARARLVGRRRLHPHAVYCGGAALALALAAGLAGGAGVLVLLAVAGYAQVQILLADYVQHYGLCRRMRPDGRTEPAGPQHSWNAPHWYSSAMMLNAPRHSDHHLHPSRPFPALLLDPQLMPVLPHSLPVMAVIALVPPWWRRVMDRRAARWA